MKKIILICLILLLAIPVSAGNIMVMKKKSGGEPPSNGVVGQSQANSDGTFAGTIYFGVFTTTTAGDVNYCHAKVLESGGDTIALAIYDSSGNRLAYGSAVAAATEASQWVNASLNTSVTLTTSTTYWLAASSPATWEGKINVYAATGDMRYDSSAYSNPLPATITNDGQVANGIIATIICNNSSGDPS